MLRRAAWAASSLARVVWVRRYVFRLLLPAVVVFLAATERPSAMEWRVGGEKAGNVAISESVRITDEALEKSPIDGPTTDVYQFSNIGYDPWFEQIGCERVWTVSCRDCTNWQQSTPIIRRVNWRRGEVSSYWILFPELLQHCRSSTDVNNLKLNAAVRLDVWNDPTIVGIESEARFDDFQEDIWPFGLNHSLRLIDGGGCRGFGGFCGNSSVVHAGAHKAELDEEKHGLSDAYSHQAKREESSRILKQPSPPSAWVAFGLLFFALGLGGGGTYLICRLIGIWPDEKHSSRKNGNRQKAA